MIPHSRPILIWLPVLAFFCLGADDPTPRGYVAVRARAPIVVDGKLDDASWADAPWTEDFQDIEGDRKPRPRFRTRARMLWDDTYFYVGAELSEPHVWGTLTRHDSVIFHDNDFEIFIDPDGDNHNYYELEINALNTEWDLFLGKPYRDGGPAVDAWEIPGLKTATHVNGTLNEPGKVDESWTVEFAIPWEVLGKQAHRASPPVDGDQWRVNFSRVEWEHSIEAGQYRKVPNRREDNWVWSPQGVVDMHRPEMWGYVQFSTQPPGKASFQPDPNLEARGGLMRVYHAQKAYQKQHQAWAPTIEALGLIEEFRKPGTPMPMLRATPEGYEATIRLDDRAGKTGPVIKVRQDSRLTIEPAEH